MKKQTIDHTGLSSTAFNIRERFSAEKSSLGAIEIHPAGCPSIYPIRPRMTTS
ncbi:MAG: hypothetical protein P9L92_02425 [Candidatus Electryonea clarkiae]|nr:hypothetical protein [Candidatus Electryonea clarkiae]MDP8285125.1 hypothetical protein [Candidatus Electryonea clarkiae]